MRLAFLAHPVSFFKLKKSKKQNRYKTYRFNSEFNLTKFTGIGQYKNNITANNLNQQSLPQLKLKLKQTTKAKKQKQKTGLNIWNTTTLRNMRLHTPSFYPQWRAPRPSAKRNA